MRSVWRVTSRARESEAKAELAHRLDHYRYTSDLLKQKSEVLEAKRKVIQAAREQLETLRSQKSNLWPGWPTSRPSCS